MQRRRFVQRAAALLGGTAAGMSLPDRLAGLPAGPYATSALAADLVLRRCLVYDGSGAPPFAADVAITAGRIAELGPRLSARGTLEVDLAGLALAPGFIDIHSHTDLALLRAPRADSKVRQGVPPRCRPGRQLVRWSERNGRRARALPADGIDLLPRLRGFLVTSTATARR
jgi:N-acyl-D-amino-acid deacylase